MRIRKGDDVTGARIDSPVAAKSIAKIRLRTAMHIQNQGILARGIEVVRFDDKNLHTLTARTGHPDHSAGRIVNVVHELIVNVSESFAGVARLFRW